VRHPVAQLGAQTIHLPVIGTHPLLHDLGRDADHVRVSDPPLLDDAHNRHPGGELPFLGLNAEDPDVGDLEQTENLGGCLQHRTLRYRLDQQRHRVGPPLVERLLDTRRDIAARLVGDQRHALARLDIQAHIDGIVRAETEGVGERAEVHQLIVLTADGDVPSHTDVTENTRHDVPLVRETV